MLPDAQAAATPADAATPTAAPEPTAPAAPTPPTPPTPTPLPALPAIDLLDTLPAADFAAAVAPLFEGAPAFLRRLAEARPFGSIERLFERARAIAHAMPVAEQIELIDAHPRLGAPPGTVSAASFVEQGYASDGAGRAAHDPDELRAQVATELARLNAAYEARFGFRYCVFVAGRPRAALLPGMAQALQADGEAEIHRALDAVVDIAMDRHARSQHESEAPTTKG
jgi:2-oxo-4-hydroxy-4-carboxy--5-ureidoimidazoline (OHCU) decarboxylase